MSADEATAGTARAERILIIAPLGADAGNLCTVLQRAGISAAPCPNIQAAAVEMPQGCGAILLTEEALRDARHRELVAALEGQPPWSDLPVILIVTGGKSSPVSTGVERLLAPLSNIVMVERPLRTATLLSTVQAALRARRRQYEVRNLLRERDELLASLERRVADRTAKLEELNGELEAFSYTVSHDLRAPLRTLESYARILSEEFAEVLPESGRHYVQRIARNAEKMDRLTRDLLTLSRVTRSNISLDGLDLDSVLSDVMERYPDLAAARQWIGIEAPLGRVFGHGPSLAQCFSNLLQNALKFIPVDREPRVRVFGRPRDERIRVFVEDNGIGIDPAHHERIFGIFERATSAHFPGTGIGLAIAKKAVEKMGGSIGVESTVGAGARFWIELPRAAGPAASPVGRVDEAALALGRREASAAPAAIS